MNHFKYRPDIDGLRALAVLPVIGFHAFPTVIQGGFVGVDIFFVISGFLISGIIFNNLENDSFSYLEFYSRRIKRIFPALIAVLISSWLFGWYILLPDEFEQLGKHIAGGIGFISNFILWNEVGYFDTAAETKPLLHLWSLGIEEQFYIFWPILLGIVWRNKFNFLAIVVFIAIISFSATIYTLHYLSSDSAFFLPHNRFWELMIGGILAYLYLHKKDLLYKNKFYLNLRSLSGSLLIITAFVFLDKDNVLFGGWALLPTLGAFFIISSPGSLINNYIFSNRILVYIGLISYPLYLWHWPLISFLHILETTSMEAMSGAVLLSFALAIVTYEFMEKRLRKNDNIEVIYILVSLSFIVLFMGLTTSQGMISPRNNSPVIRMVSEAVVDSEYPKGMTLIKIGNEDAFIKSGSKEKVIFLGDSHMQHYSPRIVKLITEDPINTKTALFFTRERCLPIPNVYFDQLFPCNANFKKISLEYALSPDIDSVVIAAAWVKLIKSPKSQAGKPSYYYLLDGQKRYFYEDGVKYALQSLEEFLSAISKHKRVFLILDNPTGKSFDPKSLVSGSRLNGFVINSKENYFQKVYQSHLDVRNLLIEIAERSNATIIDPFNHFCEGNQCRTTLDNGKPIYKDTGHIRPFYSKQFIDYLDVTLKKQVDSNSEQ